MHWYKFKVEDVSGRLYYGVIKAKDARGATKRVSYHNTNTSEVVALVMMKRGPANGVEVFPAKRSLYKW